MGLRTSYQRTGDVSDNSVYERNYIIKAYVFGPYLDRHVSLERSGFEFQMERDLIQGIPQVGIEEKSAIAKEAVGTEVIGRQEKNASECRPTWRMRRPGTVSFSKRSI